MNRRQLRPLFAGLLLSMLLAALGQLVLLGMGLGFVTQVLIVAVQNAARYEDLGAATSGGTMFRLIGGSVGTAVLGTIFASRAAAGGAAATTAGIADAFAMASAVCAIGFVLSWLVPEHPLRQTVAAATADPGRDAGEAFAMLSPRSWVPGLGSLVRVPGP